jgi:hypothetical protein
VKCDETRPQCNKCVRSGRQCDGYPAYRRTVEVAIPIAPRPGSTGSSSVSPSTSSSAGFSSSPPTSRSLAVRKPTRVVHRPQPPPRAIVNLSPTTYLPGGLPLDTQEGQYFQVFRTHTASELSGFFDSEFWTRSVLQESHSEASIRHAVVALGALYKTLEKASESPPGSPDHENNMNTFDTAPNHYNFALQQYGKALTRLRESLQTNERRPQRTVLISIVLFTCFQSFTGDHRAAIAQIQHGLGLLEERRQEAKQPLMERKDDIVEDELVQVFTRLAIQAKSYDMAFHFPHPYVIRLSPGKPDSSAPQSPSSPSDATSDASMDPHYPEVFATSQEARSALDTLCERIMRFHETLSSYQSGPKGILPAHVKIQSYGFIKQFSQWAEAFDPLLQARRHLGVSNTERAGINVLRMLLLNGSILFHMSYSTSEMNFDNFYKDFKEIVDLAKEVVVDEELTLAQARCGNPSSCRHTRTNRPPRNPAHYFPGLTSHQPGAYREEDNYCHIKASFALDLGIVAPLFVAATKCRERKLRREAIRLLMSSPRREGMWDSILSGRVAQWIMEIEEEGLTPYDGPFGHAAKEIVKEDQRVMVKTILFDLQRREATIRCGTRGVMEGDEDRRARETHIFW